MDCDGNYAKVSFVIIPRQFSCLAQTGFAALAKGVRLNNGTPFAVTEQLSRLTSPGIILITSWRYVTKAAEGNVLIFPGLIRYGIRYTGYEYSSFIPVLETCLKTLTSI